jgi:hypothetical protein
MKLLMFLIFQMATLSFAVNPADIPEYTQQGSFVTLRVVPKDRTAKIFVVGHKAAELDFKNEAQILSVSLVNNRKKEVLNLNKQGDYYEVKGLPPKNEPYQLMIQTQAKGKMEELKVDIPSQKP